MNDSTQDLPSDACADSAVLSRAVPRRDYGPRSAAPARARDRDRSLRPARPGRAATTVLVVGLVLLGAAAAEAQTVRTLVSNAAQTGDDSANTSGNDHAQLFHTGGHAAGYTLTSVVVNSDDVEDDDFDVEVCEEDGTADEFPSTAAGDCTALTAPANFVGVGNVIFTHTGLALSANTNYVVVIKQRGTGSVEIDSTSSSGEDASGLSDWSIKNKFYWKSGSTWMIKSGSNEALSIVVFGYARTVGDATDATLSALSVSGATLSPVFGAATTTPEQYLAVFANSVSQATITATTSESTATVEYLDGSDATLTDADTMTAGLQVNLSVGTNTVKVKVTAPDTTTTETYIVNVFRAAVPVACSPASMSNRIWTGNLTVGRQQGSTAVGYSPQYGALDNRMFSFKSNAYNIDTVAVDAFGIFGFSLGTATLGTDANDLIWHVGTEQFALVDADNYASSTNTYFFYTNVPTWTDGDAVCLALTEVVVPPAVSSVALTSTPGSDNTYAIGDAVAATVTFDAAVDITGTPQLELDFAGTPKPANCTAATNTTTMVCRYTVALNDSAPNGIAIGANTLTLNGGTITATGSTTITADLDHSVVSIDTGHKVDGSRPTLVTTGSDAPTTSTDGTQVILTFSEDISAADRTKITIGIGGGNVASTSAASAAGPTVELDLSTFIDATVMLTVALAADAVEDAAANGNLAVSATAVTNAITPEPPGQPAAPSVSSVAGSTTSLLVTWTAPANTGPAIDTYDLQYRQGTGGAWTNGPQNVSGTSATITGLTANTLYQVQVLATNADGDSPWSPSGSGQTNTAGNSAPTFANPTETRSVAENSPASTDVGLPVTATDTDSGDTLTYTLEGTDAASFNLVTISGSAQIRTRSGVTYDYEAQPSYTVIVKADDGNGGTDTVTVTIDLTDDVDERPLAPAAPRVTATPDTTDSLTVRWSAPSNTGRPAIDDYDLQYREGTTGTWTNGPQRVSGTSATIAGLTAARTAYQVQVRATNADGAGAWSPPGRIRTTPPPPAVGPPSPPRNLTAMAGDQAVALSWSRPADNGGTPIVRYEYRQQEGDGPVGAWQIIEADPPPTTHRVTGLTNGTSYTFQVRAVNTRHASPPSEPASATPEPERAPFEVAIVGVPEVAVAGASYELTAQSDAEEALVYAWRVAYGEGGSVEPTDTQTVVWTAPSGVTVAWIRVDATREEDGATAGQSAYVRVDVPAPPTTLALSHDAAPAEGGEPVTVTATLDTPAPATGLTVTLTVGGTAMLDTDYTLSSTTITLAAGETAGTVTITVIDDAEDDDGETIVLAAASTTPALTAAPLTLTIKDNDVTPVPALPLLGHLLLALGLTGAGARLLSRDPRVPPAA